MNTTTKTLDWMNYAPAEGKFDGRVILVTGAAGGIGRAVSLALSEAGSTVILLDHKLRHLEKLYDEIVAAGHTEPVILPQDLSRVDTGAVATIANGINQDFGRLDGLLHNAGELGSPGPLRQYPDAAWSAVMQVNLQAPWLLTRGLIPLLENGPDSSVVFTSAACGRSSGANWGAYAIAYAGIESQMGIWSAEMRNVSDVRFNSIDPGPVNTAMRRVSHPGEAPDSILQPEDIVPAYLLLLGPDSIGINGQALELQSGR